VRVASAPPPCGPTTIATTSPRVAPSRRSTSVASVASVVIPPPSQVPVGVRWPTPRRAGARARSAHDLVFLGEPDWRAAVVDEAALVFQQRGRCGAAFVGRRRAQPGQIVEPELRDAVELVGRVA